MKSVIALICLLSIGANANISEDIEQRIRRNTFLFVPINQYAMPIEVIQARKLYELNCKGEHGAPNPELLPINQKLNCKTLKQCQVKEECRLQYSSFGSAFLAENGRKLYTALHVAINSVKMPFYFFKQYFEQRTTSERKEYLAQIGVQFLLLDINGNLLYDSREEEAQVIESGDPMAIVYTDTGRSPNGNVGFKEAIPNDFIQIQLQRDMGDGIPMAASSQSIDFLSAGFYYEEGERFVSLLGQEESVLALKQKTGNFNEITLSPLSQNREEYASRSEEEIMQDWGWPLESIARQIDECGRDRVRAAITSLLVIQERNARDMAVESHPKALFTNARAQPGNSGGPVMNSQGEVVGITVNGFHRILTERTDVKSCREQKFEHELGEKEKENAKVIQRLSFGSGVHLLVAKD